jgi:NADPH2:quinone reductase
VRAVRYDRYGGVDALYIGDLPDPEPSPGEIVVRVIASALNPGALPALEARPSYVPGRDIAGVVAALGAGVGHLEVDEAVLGRLQSWDAHAELVAVPADHVIHKPAALSWDVAGSLFTTPMAGLAAVRAVQPGPGDLVVVSGASGGVGLTAAQLAVRLGASVIGLTSERHIDVLHRHGITAVLYGSGEEGRLRDAVAGRGVDAFIDAVGGSYIRLALRLGVPRKRIDTVVDYHGAATHGVQALGTSDAGGLPALTELAQLAASGQLDIPIAQTFRLSAVQQAYRALAERTSHGRIVLHPQETA